jgi:hypothetical protein
MKTGEEKADSSAALRNDKKQAIAKARSGIQGFFAALRMTTVRGDSDKR